MIELKFRAELKSSLDTHFYGHKISTIVFEEIHECDFDKRNPEDISPEVHIRIPLNFGHEMFIHAGKGSMEPDEDGWFHSTFHLGYLSHNHFELNIQFNENGEVLDYYVKGWDDYGEFLDDMDEDIYIGHDDIQVITD